MSGAVFNPDQLHVMFDPTGDPKRPWVVDGMHSYQDRYVHVFVPDLFRTDFQSYPRWLGRVLVVLIVVACWYPAMMFWIALAGSSGVLLMEPYARDLRASVFHDKAYADHVHKFRADAMYRIIMKADGVVWWRILLNFWAVRLFGWPAWWAKKVKRMP